MQFSTGSAPKASKGTLVSNFKQVLDIMIKTYQDYIPNSGFEGRIFSLTDRSQDSLIKLKYEEEYPATCIYLLIRILPLYTLMDTIHASSQKP